MNNESLTQKFKSCNACKRLLPTNFFGIRKFSADGYNPCCKDCRNFRRRMAYQSPSESTDPILPLNEHNRHFMWSLLDSSTHEILTGLDLKNLEAVKVAFRKNNMNIFFLTVTMNDNSEYTHIHGGQKASFIDFVLPLLMRLQIRLFHSMDAIALTNWGLSKK